ncbi:OmpA family protein [Photobacterium ganghwense]|uniref:Flagellar protein MotY n=1 Tax=Photobacterium ganghwense TaxID=320778 RepID=A0A0J1K8S0_9GAMM|nr:OmpA family protein [Photobacterium ganghwense]KLV10742.1 flagellar protein MotY [Photobacterium ganghwense]PSU11086.1 OmpA family protein [Photobacterium ganghwense]QSV13191.1 OmpA family protein [Photobacterium ganghwense]
MMKSLLTYSGLALCMAMAVNTSVSARQLYVAKPALSSWKVAVDTPLECRMLHTVPNFGEAQFVSRAGKKLNLDFELKMRRPMGQSSNVSLVSMPPRWMPGDKAERITRLKFYKQFDGYVGGQTAWTMLSELESGRYPTFSYADWQHRNKLVEVSLSAVSFQNSYNQFSQCIDNLLPYSFDDIAFTVLHYGHNSDELNKMSQQRLAQIADFIRYSDDVDLVLVAAYTDAEGSKDENQQLSERRAKKLEDYFVTIGMPKDRIQVQAYGKRRPIADSSNPIGRGKNRRVVISLGRSII